MRHVRVEYARRTDADGRPCVTPMIGGWPVADIPEEEFTHRVQQAVNMAYELGWNHCNYEHAAIGDVQMMEPEIMKQVIVEITPAGSVKIDAKGFTGSACMDATAPLEKVLLGGGTKKDTKKKSDFFVANSGRARASIR